MSDTILSEGLAKPEKEWPGLFTLYRDSDGKVRVELGTITAPLEWTLRWKLSKNEGNLATALVSVTNLSRLPICAVPEPKHLVPFGGSNVLEIYQVAKALHNEAAILRLVLEQISDAIGEELETVKDSAKPKPERLKAKKGIEAKLSKVLEAFILKGSRKAHGTARVVAARYGEALLAWAVLDAARFLVWAYHKLPSKQAVKALLITQDKTLRNVSAPKWADAFRDAGLATLPRQSTQRLGSRK